MTISLRDGETLQDYAFRVTAELHVSHLAGDVLRADIARLTRELASVREQFRLSITDAAMNEARLRAVLGDLRVDIAAQYDPDDVLVMLEKIDAALKEQP